MEFLHQQQREELIEGDDDSSSEATDFSELSDNSVSDAAEPAPPSIQVLSLEEVSYDRNLKVTN